MSDGSSNEISIEPARGADLPSIRSLLAELLAAMTDTEGLDLERAVASYRALISIPGQYVLVARQSGTALGFISFSTRQTLLHPAPSALIDELVVSRGARGTGVGRQLIEAAISASRELGCCEVEVSTEKSNTGARRFYKACGFEEDAVLLELHLTDT